MITVTSTPNHAGVSIRGDLHDLQQLYDALHEVVGQEGEYRSLEGARLRVLGLCYDIRHALMGDREVEFVDNGMHANLKRHLGVLAPDKNVYYAWRTLWPELLFVTMALNEFAEDRTRRAKHAHWDPVVATVRAFQAAVASCIRNTVPETTAVRMLNAMNRRFSSYSGYCTQYIDMWNVKFLKMAPEKRLKQLSVIAKRFDEKDADYWGIQASVKATAREHVCPEDAVHLVGWDYPEEVEW